MSTKYLRHIPTGILYVYQEVYAHRKDFEAVPDTPAAPAPAPASRARRSMPRDPVAEAFANAEAIGVDASRNLP